MSESWTRISKFYDPTDSKYKFHKTRIKNWLTIGFELGYPGWELTVITTTPCSTCTMMGSLKVLYTHLQSLGTILETFHFPLTVQVISKSIPNIQSSIKLQQNLTIICLIIYKHSTHTKWRYPARWCVGSEANEQQEQKVLLSYKVDRANACD